MSTKLDSRQITYSGSLLRVATTNPTELDNIIASLDAESKPPLMMRADTGTARQVTIDALELSNPETGERRTIPPINDTIPSFTSGTLLFPTTTAGTVTVTPGSATAMPTMVANEVVRCGVFLNDTGNLELSFGTVGASEAAAGTPPNIVRTFAIGQIIVRTDGSGNIQDIPLADVVMYIGGGSGSGGGLVLESQNSAFTAEAGKHYLVDTSGGPVTVTLPAGDDGSIMRFTDAAQTFDSNNLTLDPAAGEQIAEGAVDENYIIDVKLGFVQLQWDSVQGLWTLDSALPADSTLQVASETQPGIVSTGTQSFGGAKTFSSALTVTPTTNQLVLGTTNTTTISATAPSSSLTYTIPDVGASANFVMDAGAQTIAGAKTFSDAVTVDKAGGIFSSLKVTGNDSEIVTELTDTQHTTNHNFASGTNPLISINPIAQAGTEAVNYRFFRNTNTTGNITLDLHRGNGTAAVGARISPNGGDSFFNIYGGNVGIGTTSPNRPFEIARNTGSMSGTISSPATIRLRDTDTAGGGTANTTDPYAAVEFYSDDASNDGPRVRALIGAVYGDIFGARSGLSLRVSDATGAAFEALKIAYTGAVTLGPSTGNVTHIFNGILEVGRNGTGIGENLIARSTTSTLNSVLSIYKQNVTDETQVHRLVIFSVDNGTVFDSAGGIQSTKGGTPSFFSGASDYRAKNITGNMAPVLDRLCQVEMKKFTYKNSGIEAEGPIAQQLFTLFPEKVIRTDDGTGEEIPEGVEPWTVAVNWDYELIKAIQELNAKLDEANARIATLEGGA